jgi:hypothetical protein
MTSKVKCDNCNVTFTVGRPASKEQQTICNNGHCRRRFWHASQPFARQHLGVKMGVLPEDVDAYAPV